jgi:hypothetical protein
MVQNACMEDQFLQIRQCIHSFSDACLVSKSNPARWHPLLKIQIFVDTIPKTLAAGWILGKQTRMMD